MFDKTVGIAKEIVARNPDTLLIVTGDHTHGISIIGAVSDDAPGEDMRDKVGVYDNAAFPNYVDADKDSYLDRIDVTRRLLKRRPGP